MATLKDFAKDYVPKKTKNIAELPQVAVDVELMDGEGTDEEGKTFRYKYITVNGEEYRVPFVVIGQLKDMQSEIPNLKLFKVTKKGEGLKTRYTVIPLNTQ